MKLLGLSSAFHDLDGSLEVLVKVIGVFKGVFMIPMVV